MFKTHMSNCFATRNDAAIKLHKQKSRYMPFRTKFGEDHSCIGAEIPKTQDNFDTRSYRAPINCTGAYRKQMQEQR